eukprot:TRINITY_DN7379_c0_g1_i2.p1 TRINITY_DN7379_c0_g1~~TRINITY_DN7379_c0_g1_i2.p1  ORF type:complete len:148 (+),score=15.99 TRINITY_DN7379_c0_g1_i2:934-1377(+)
MEKIVNELKFPDKSRLPAAVQVRYLGYKGMLVLDKKRKSRLYFRESMHKFEDTRENEGSLTTMGICDYAKPFRQGYLIQQYVAILSACGIPNECFEEVQNVYNDHLENMLMNPVKAFNFAVLRDPVTARKLLKRGILAHQLIVNIKK